MPGGFVLTEIPWTNCHAMKIKIKKPTQCSNLPIKASETVNRAASCAFTVNYKQAMAPLK